MSTTQKRISEKDLQSLVDTINEITHSPVEPITGGAWNVGNYHLSCAYGGYNIHRVRDEYGIVSCPIQHGYYTAKELYYMLVGYIYGLSNRKDS